MKNEPSRFLPLEKFWEADKRRADRDAAILAAGILIGFVITAVFAWIIFEIVNRHS